MAQYTTLLGMPKSTLVANAILDTVVQIALRRNALQVTTFLAELVLRKDVIALDVASVITLWDFVNAMKDTMETDASIKLFSAKKPRTLRIGI